MKRLLLFCLLFSTALFSGEIPKVLPTGSALPEFSLPGIDGKTYTQADFADAEILCVIFTCNHCPDAVAAASRMEQLHQDYKGKGVAIVAVSTNNPESLRPNELGYSPYGDSFEEMKPFAESYGWTFPYLYDGEKQELGTACGAQATPHAFVFGKDRKLLYSGRLDDAKRKSGPVESSIIRNVFDALLAGEEVEKSETRAFGCSTKWLFKKEQVAELEKEWEERPVVVELMDEALAKKIRANDQKKVRVINFWATYCGPCVAEFPELIETYRRFENRNFDFISISMDTVENRKVVQRFLDSRNAAIPDRTLASIKREGRGAMHYIWDGEDPDILAEAIFPEWTGALPLTLIISPEGKVVWSKQDAVDMVELRSEIIKALK